jgi:hypothetical protein
MPESPAFRRAVEARDWDLVRDSLREDVVLHSPILFRPFEGRDAALAVLIHVEAVFEDFAYTDEAHAEDGAVALRFKARVGDRELEGIDFLELDGDGRVADITVFIRPLSALERFKDEMAERLAAAGVTR